MEAAEASRREAEQRELEKKERKNAMAVARREKAERAAQGKNKPGSEQQDEDPRKTVIEATKKKAVPAGTTKSLLVDSSNNPGTSIQGVHLKVKNIPQAVLNPSLTLSEAPYLFGPLEFCVYVDQGLVGQLVLSLYPDKTQPYRFLDST